MGSKKGFTLLEAMIAVAIIGVVAALSVSTMSGVGARNAKQNAANEILSLLQSARTISEQNGSDVYVMVYPSMKLKWNATHSKLVTGGAATGGSGALVIYEDVNGNFTGDGGVPDCSGSSGECSWSGFDPTAGSIYSATTDRVVKVLDLADYPKKNVVFGGSGTGWAAPFTAAATTSCSFCANNKGAILFSDGQAVLLNDVGVANGFIGGLALRAVDNTNNESRIAVVRSTALITSVKSQ